MNHSSDDKDHVLIGIIVDAHGVRGTNKVRWFADSPALMRPGSVLLAREGRSGSEKHLEINWIKPHTRTVLISFIGIDDRDQAEALIGSKLYIPTEMLPVLDDDTYYWRDLIGMDVYTIEREYLGRIESIIETGSNDVYVVNEGQKEVLIPALESVVVDIDTDRKRMEVNLPKGLI